MQNSKTPIDVREQGGRPRFTLRGKTMQYSFHVDAKGNLEHLYWGELVDYNDDIQYLQYSNIALPFDPRPAIMLEDSSLVESIRASDENTILQWRVATKMSAPSQKIGSIDERIEKIAKKIDLAWDPAELEARRRENTTWRMMHMEQAQQQARQESSGSGSGSKVMKSQLLSSPPPSSRLQTSPQMESTKTKTSISIDDSSKLNRFMSVSKSVSNLQALQHLEPSDSSSSSSNISRPRLSSFHTGNLDKSYVTERMEFLRAQMDAKLARPDLRSVGVNAKLLEVSTSGTGDYRSPSVMVRYQTGSRLSPLTYKRYRILSGKPPLQSGLPSSFCDVGAELQKCQTLVVTMEDVLEKLEVDLYYTIWSDRDVICRHSVIRNTTSKPVTVKKLASAMVDFEAGEHYVTHLAGCWAGERAVTTTKLVQMQYAVSSSRGTSSHQHNPFLVLSYGNPEESHGNVYGFNLVYSGNFKLEVDRTETGRARINCGLNRDLFEWGKVSLLINTWEAMYFDVFHDRVIELAQRAREIGVEMLVLDDGWFKGRNDDTTSLGDWVADKTKLPRGLDALIQDINNIGLRFGIWIEPEMVNVNSDLFRDHPDWALEQKGRPRSEGRNQLVLDYTRAEVREHIFQKLKLLLQTGNIEYVKWDMNRHLSEVYSCTLPPKRQGEIYHRQVLGVYKLWHDLTNAFPHILFESCSGGGGRFDPGMLAYSPQIWTSDNTDAMSRIMIQYGTSFAYPLSCQGAHISMVPNHQTFRVISLKTRFLVALCGTFGFELDLEMMSPQERLEVSQYVKLRKELAPIINTGEFYRLWSPFIVPRAAWMCVSPDQSTALVFIFMITKGGPGQYLPRLQLQGLDPQARYALEELCPGYLYRTNSTGKLIEDRQKPVYQFDIDITLSGKALMKIGLPVNIQFDGDSLAFRLCRV
eukprot:g3132.t1